jgi:hypothetical protein
MIAPPGRASARAAEIRALFAEARRRRRRRRLLGSAVGLMLAGSAVTSLAIGGRAHDPAPRIRAGEGPAVVAQRSPARFTLPPARVAWLDYWGGLHIGDVAAMTQHVVATVRSDEAGRLVRAGGHLYWPDINKTSAPIRDYDIATGRIRHLAPGQSVFASADGRHIYIVQTGTRVIERPADGSGGQRRLRVPAGWYLPGNPMGVAGVADGGIVVSASDYRSGPRAAIAVWTPRTGQVKIIGTGLPWAAATPHAAHYSLLAWTHASCTILDCPIEITNTSTLATVTVRSPLGYGFTEGDGVFSPDGKRLALFARRASLNSSRANQSELAIVSTGTAAVRLVPAAHLLTQEDAGWAAWLPGGQRLLAGALLYSYAVDLKTLAARPFFFLPGAASRYGGHDIMNSGDINFSVTVLPPAAPGARPYGHRAPGRTGLRGERR